MKILTSITPSIHLSSSDYERESSTPGFSIKTTSYYNLTRKMSLKSSSPSSNEALFSILEDSHFYYYHEEDSSTSESSYSSKIIKDEFYDCKRPQSDETKILDGHLYKQLQPYIPSKYQFCEPKTLVYCGDLNGYSLISLYNGCQQLNKDEGCLLAIRDDQGHIFGAYCSRPFNSRTGPYGTGECFLWKLDDNDRVKIFKSTGKNDYFMMAERDYMAIGCGDSKFGIWLDSLLCNGRSERVPTFDNEILASSSTFKCVDIELWKFNT